MSRAKLIVLVIILVGLVGGAVWWRNQDSTTGIRFALLDADQLAELAQNPSTKLRALTVTKANGPVINVMAPSGFSLSSPVDFNIQIRPRGDVAVDMKSLRIEYHLGPIWVNLTNRVMGQATINGTNFRARGADLPPGDHALRLTVRDEKSRVTQALVTFTVAK